MPVLLAAQNSPSYHPVPFPPPFRHRQLVGHRNWHRPNHFVSPVSAAGSEVLQASAYTEPGNNQRDMEVLSRQLLCPHVCSSSRPHPTHVPVAVQEIVEDVHEVVEIGITSVHLHARNEQTGESTSKAEVYRDLIAGIRKFSRDLVISTSLSGRTFKEFEQRTEPLKLEGDIKPDMGSLTLSSVNFNREPSVNSPDMIQALAGEMKSRGVLPELEAFDAGMIDYARYLERKGLLEPPHYFNLLLGNIAVRSGRPAPRWYNDPRPASKFTLELGRNW